VVEIKIFEINAMPFHLIFKNLTNFGSNCACKCPILSSHQCFFWWEKVTRGEVFQIMRKT
jgi:hypothetical protein